MNIGQVIAWILGNLGTITNIIGTIEAIAQELMTNHGNAGLDAYAKAILSAVEGFLQGLGANTTTTPTEKAAVTTVVAQAGAPAAQLAQSGQAPAAPAADVPA